MSGAIFGFLVILIGVTTVGFIVGLLGPYQPNLVISDVLSFASFMAGFIFLFQAFLRVNLFDNFDKRLGKLKRIIYLFAGLVLMFPALLSTETQKFVQQAYGFSIPVIHFTWEDLVTSFNQNSAWINEWLKAETILSNDVLVGLGIILVGLGIIFYLTLDDKNKKIKQLYEEAERSENRNRRLERDNEVLDAQVESARSSSASRASILEEEDIFLLDDQLLPDGPFSKGASLANATVRYDPGVVGYDHQRRIFEALDRQRSQDPDTIHLLSRIDAEEPSGYDELDSDQYDR